MWTCYDAARNFWTLLRFNAWSSRQQLIPHHNLFHIRKCLLLCFSCKSLLTSPRQCHSYALAIFPHHGRPSASSRAIYCPPKALRHAAAHPSPLASIAHAHAQHIENSLYQPPADSPPSPPSTPRPRNPNLTTAAPSPPRTRKRILGP